MFMSSIKISFTFSLLGVMTGTTGQEPGHDNKVIMRINSAIYSTSFPFQFDLRLETFLSGFIHSFVIL